MSDTAPLRTAVDRLADRFRAAPHSRLRGAAAQAGLALARDLAVAAQWLERPEREPELIPDDGMFVVGDQIAVAGHDLAAALDTHPERSDVLEQALRNVAETARQAGL